MDQALIPISNIQKFPAQVNYVFISFFPLIPTSVYSLVKVGLAECGLYSNWFFHSIYKFDLSVCLYPINVITRAEPIGSKLFVYTHVTPQKAWTVKVEKCDTEKMLIFFISNPPI